MRVLLPVLLRYSAIIFVEQTASWIGARRIRSACPFVPPAQGLEHCKRDPVAHSAGMEIPPGALSCKIAILKNGGFHARVIKSNIAAD
ncbi:hypothetical protein SAMN05216456_0873 [Devosia crocina]|uniref:Uncharacterized protein n=1 Tax=Devosia crocina TaxID=429728 RepID=A0A1I7N5H5_9HYPH|nr:hypothetical protein SAMN05216456_0873 [Devosia crocina]